jgi:hypothetical protein
MPSGYAFAFSSKTWFSIFLVLYNSMKSYAFRNSSAIAYKRYHSIFTKFYKELELFASVPKNAILKNINVRKNTVEGVYKMKSRP